MGGQLGHDVGDHGGNFPYVRGSRDAVDRSKKISNQLKKDYCLEAQKVKLLLLGAGQSGKSTIVKQMKLIHPLMDRTEKGFTDKEKLEAREAIYANMADAMMSLLDAVNYLNIEGLEKLMKQAGDERRIRELGKMIYQYGDKVLSSDYTPGYQTKGKFDSIIPTPDVTNALKQLWSCRTIQAAYERRNEFQLIDSTEYFMVSISRICANGYIPTDQDVLRTRVQTTGVVKIEFDFQATTFQMLDVGGHRSERKKWIHCFDNVTSVLFVVSISEYDQVLEEDKTTNRMIESMQLFDDIANNAYFHDKPFIIFFNKHDLFVEKISRKGIRETFPDYKGPIDSPSDSLQFLIKKYISLSKADKRKRPIYPHTTTATDTQLINYVFCSVAEIILNDLLKNFGFF